MAATTLTEPWSKRHKQMTKAGSGGLSHSLSNSFAEPLSHAELVERSLARGDAAIVAEYSDHSLDYTPNGGSADLREEIETLREEAARLKAIAPPAPAPVEE